MARAVETCSPLAPPPRRRNAAEVLATMLDLQASVKLAHALGASSGAPGALATENAEPAAAPLFLLGDYVRKRLSAIEDAVNNRLARPFDGARARVASLVPFVAELVSSEATASSAAARAFAESTWRGYRSLLLASLAHARAEVAELREEVASDLRQAGGRGAALEAIDAAVRTALAGSVPALCERLATAMERPFVSALAAAIQSLPAPVGAESVGAWFGEQGVLGKQLAQTRELTRALLARDARMLEALVDAAYAEVAA
jgi:hypothetical protein